jgi:menaquinone-dependent protoporphyrinogen oxidase
VWLFSSGPLGTETKTAQGRDVRDAAVPGEIDEIRKSIKPRGHRVFFGALDSKKLSLGHKTIRRMPAARKLLPEGDFRYWKDIEAWADEIAAGLKAS